VSRTTIRDPRAAAAQGTPAGIVSRLLANAIDFGVVWIIYFAILIAVAAVRFLVERHGFRIEAPNPLVTVVGQWLVVVLYLGSGWSTTGRTVGKTVLGLRVLTADGKPLAPPRAFARALLCASFYPGLLWIIVSPKNAALHDVAFRTQVIYDWSTVPIVETAGPATS